MSRFTPPPYSLTPGIIERISEISEILGELRAYRTSRPDPVLRKQNSIRTIHGSLAIEGNSFSLNQMTALMNGKRVVGPKKEILEVQNTIRAYSSLSAFKPDDSKSLLRAHQLLMEGLLPRPGRFRSSAVGILKGSKVAHIAPKAAQVPELIENLLRYLKQSKDHPLIKSCVFHYEFEFIHPFEDGNGRLGRLWQTRILMKLNPIFEWIPIESQIHKHQTEYYRALEASDRAGDSTRFMEWMLGIISEALLDFARDFRPSQETAQIRLETAKKHFKDTSFGRKEYLKLLKSISSPTASRDLAKGVEEGILIRTGEKRLATYRFNG
ncbi:MAG: Fic family protein [Proteobacteria bacterium]|nr:Fic family protein [Pseudomonadota bacterium]